MKNLNIIIESIKDNLYCNNELFSNSLSPLCEYIDNKINKEDFFFQKDIDNCSKELSLVINETLDIKERTIFYIRASLNKINNKFLSVFFSDIFKKDILNYKNEFLNVLTNEKIQDMYIIWYKEFGYCINFKNNIYSEIFNLPKFKEIILNDENFISKKFSSSESDCFFRYLPYDYGHLISYYKGDNPFTLEDLYNNFFDKIKEDDRSILEHIHLKLANEKYNPYNIDISYKIKEFSSFLKSIRENTEYIDILKKLHTKTNIEYKSIMSFICKYSNAKFFQLIYNQSNYSAETIEKIKYLSNAEKIKDVDIINNLDNFSLSDLMNFKKNQSALPEIKGGPDTLGDYRNYFSKESSNREIRRINKNGSYKVEHVDGDSHLGGLTKIYKDLVFEKDDNTAIEKAIKAAKTIGSITFIIEAAQCFIIIPIPLSKKQLKVCLKWIKKSNEKAKFGLIQYNINNNNIEILNNDLIDKEQAINQLISTKNAKTNKKRFRNM